MFKIKIVSVGKLKKGYWAEAIAHYEKMMRTTLRVEAITVKDCPEASGDERKRLEGERILQKVGARDTIVALHETGKLMKSLEFAAFMRPLLESPGGCCCFVIGGAFGLSSALLAAAEIQLSLSPLTMPHELAHVVLYEQLFRATTIMANRTYHY